MLAASVDAGVPVKVLIADDHPIICVALAEMLKSAFAGRLAQVETVSDSNALLAIDLFMPGASSSIPLLERVVAQRPDVRVVAYTGADQPMLALNALDGGAQAFVSKASGPDVVIEAIRALSNGDRFIDPRIDLDAARRHPWQTLTPGERAVLVALAGGQHLHAIALDSDRSYKTVTAHKYNALRKLSLGSKTDLKHYLSQLGLGYLLA
jgi:two-component system capsular synthesis response regulator RcsB